VLKIFFHLQNASMTEEELKSVFSENIKKYRNGKYTQESLAEKIGVSSQNINDIEGKRRFPRTDTLVKIAEALNVEVYQLFIPQNITPIKIENTPENERIRSQMTMDIVEEIRNSVNKMLDKIKKEVK
jgi:transcriptional regulator with XRE-family HTH domain